MRIITRQIYVEVGVIFPFSHHMQVWLTEQLSNATSPTAEFIKAYGVDFDVVVNLSARRDLPRYQLKGPSVFKKTKDVEYTLFLPYGVIVHSENSRHVAARLVLQGVIEVLSAVRLHTDVLATRADSIVEHLATDPAMLNGPWPVA